MNNDIQKVVGSVFCFWSNLLTMKQFSAMKNILLTISCIAIITASCSNSGVSNETQSEPDSLMLKKSYEAERKTKAPLLAYNSENEFQQNK